MGGYRDPGAEPEDGGAFDEDGNVNPEVAFILARNMLATLQDISADVKHLVPQEPLRGLQLYEHSDDGKRLRRFADRARSMVRDAERKGGTTDLTLAEMREHADALGDFADSVLVPF